MSIKTNYHIHCEFDDGRNSCEEYVIEAIDKNMECIGFSAHWPITYDNDWTMKKNSVQKYIEKVNHLNEKYPEINILLGCENDYFFASKEDEKFFEKYKPQFDYIMGAVHLHYDDEKNKVIYYDGGLDTREDAIQYFEGEKEFCLAYYKDIINVVDKYRPDVIAHFDVVKKYNHFRNDFDESSDWYKEIVCRALDVVKRCGTILEINTGGITRGFTHHFYPSEWIIKQCLKRDIPITVNSDAHCKNDLTAYFDEVHELLIEIGFKSYMKFKDGVWKQAKL